MNDRRSNAFRYMIYGAIFGFVFPVFSTALDIYLHRLPLTPASILRVQWSNPLHLVIDTAPFFLGLFARFAGWRQDRIEEANQKLQSSTRKQQQAVSRIESLRVDLERQVRNRTADLALRKHQIETAALVAQELAKVRQLPSLLDSAARLISERFDFYHVGVFLLDAKGKYAVLQAASSEGGVQMLAAGHALEVGKQGIVGLVAGTGQPRVALDVDLDPGYFDNPYLPNTRSELALPLLAADKVVGVLDVQSKKAGAFTDEDVEILQILSEQIALGIETANLFEEKEEALESLERTYSELTREAWEKTFLNSPELGFVCDEDGQVLRLAGNWDPELREAFQTGEPSQEESRLILPIRIRSLVVGAVKLSKRPESGEWTEDEVQLMRSIADQVSVALDNARLYSDSRRRAERERLVSEISTRIRGTNDPKQIMELAVQELRNALQANRAKFLTKTGSVKSANPVSGDPADNGKSEVS